MIADATIPDATNLDMKFKLVIAYDGTSYQGWQVQKIGTGVQEKIDSALGNMFPGV